jgi:hypothetical protein
MNRDWKAVPSKSCLSLESAMEGQHYVRRAVFLGLIPKVEQALEGKQRNLLSSEVTTIFRQHITHHVFYVGLGLT